MKLSLLFLSALFVTNFANASVEAVYAESTSEITNAEEFELHIKGSEPTEKQIVEAVAKRIRHSIYKRRATIDGSKLTKLALQTAMNNLSKTDGQFKGMPESDNEKLVGWIEDKLVREEAYKLEVRFNYMGADGISVYYIFLPTELTDPVLSIGYDQKSDQ